MFGIPSSSELKSDSFLMGWNVAAAATVLLPLLIMTVARSTHVGEGGGDNDNNNNNNNNNNANGNWWGGNNEQGSGDQTPWWWFGGNGASGDEEEPQGRGSVIFVYVYATALFLAMILHGNFVLGRNADFGALQGALFVFTHLAFLTLILVAGLGAIQTEEGRELEEHGWYGQFSVCVFLTTFFWTLHGIVFGCLLRQRKAARAAAGINSESSNNKNNQSGFLDWISP
ncbi:expressed unknown protein [Seminavis robusta]|uniref:Uncharacterized protein n=1 Tax=Seminavis robusta TaxID=568900 RepID=A0A9N8HDI1_9STRA|nr:expressed unknown protein [Seminavis robusta]|eukprot:Sro260_g101630.1 n/a (228) ;mRNA; r:61144-61827